MFCYRSYRLCFDRGFDGLTAINAFKHTSTRHYTITKMYILIQKSISIDLYRGMQHISILDTNIYNVITTI